jgi:hypothetical protein
LNSLQKGDNIRVKRKWYKSVLVVRTRVFMFNHFVWSSF